MTKGDLDSAPDSAPDSAHISRILCPPHLPTWVAPLALGLCRLNQRLQAFHHCRVSLIEVLGHQPWPNMKPGLGGSESPAFWSSTPNSGEHFPRYPSLNYLN